VDDNTNSQYRFGFAGGIISSNILERSQSWLQVLVASGSLNEGLPTDFIKK
jgi:6-phosphofructokinase 2